MLTLTEAQKYTTNMVRKGVIKEIIKDSVVMERLPFMDVVGNAYQYLRESTLPTAEFYDPNEVWAESTGDVVQRTAGIKILGGDADVDNFLKATRSDKTDITAETIASKAKAVKHTFLDRFWYGNSATSSKEFDGLHTILNGSDFTAQVIHLGSGTTGAALSASQMDAAVDLIRDGKPDLIVTTRALRRRIKQYLRSKNNVELNFQSYSGDAMNWNDVKLGYDDFLTQTEALTSGAYSAKTAGATGSVFFLSFGNDAVCGLQNGGLETIKLGQLHDKDSQRYRIRWYVGLAVFRTIREALIDGATNVAMID